MKKLGWKAITILSGTVLSLIINLILLPQLPEKIGMQISTSGNLRNFVPKGVFIFLVPAFLLLDFIYAMKNDNAENTKPLVVGIIIFAVNIITIVFNI